MAPFGRSMLGVSLLLTGLAAQAGLDCATSTTRPALKRALETLPMQLGAWDGRDEPIDPEVRVEAQTDDCLNRIYEHAGRPGRRVTLWINYSRYGLNMRHSPEICLPGHGYEKVESLCRPLTIRRGEGPGQAITKLAYVRGELVQGVGFWYYIFGEGPWERYVRSLPITSRSSHGRTTRGSGLTVEIFCPGESDPEGELLCDFAESLLPELEPLLPDDRDSYAIP